MPVHHHFTLFFQVMGIAERFEKIKRYKEISVTRWDQRAEQSIYPDMALNRSTALSHSMRFSPFHMPPFEQACFSKNIGGKDSSLTAYSYYQDIKTSAHFLASLTIAPVGQSCTHTEHPLQRSFIRACSSANSIAGQPNRTQVPHPVHESVLTVYRPRLTPARRADMTHICLAMTTFTPFLFLTSCRILTIPVIS